MIKVFIKPSDILWEHRLFHMERIIPNARHPEFQFNGAEEP